MANLTVSSDIDTFMGSANNAAALTNLGALPLAGGALTGVLTVPNGSTSAPGLRFAADAGYGLSFVASQGIKISLAGQDPLTVTAGYVTLGNNVFLGWGSSGVTYSAGDLWLLRDAANTLAQRNSTNAQTSRVYGTYTDASNYVRASLAASSTLVTLAAETAGTGADNIDINLTTAGTGLINLATQTASVDVIAASTHSVQIKIGGTTYKVLLST